MTNDLTSAKNAGENLDAQNGHIGETKIHALPTLALVLFMTHGCKEVDPVLAPIAQGGGGGTDALSTPETEA